MSAYGDQRGSQQDVQNAVYASGGLGGLALVAALSLLVGAASAEGLAVGALVMGALIPGMIGAALFLAASGLRQGRTNTALRAVNVLKVAAGVEGLATARALMDGSPVGALAFAAVLAATLGVSFLIVRAVKVLGEEGPEAA